MISKAPCFHKNQPAHCCICGRTDPLLWGMGRGMPLVRCQGCGLIFVWPRETNQQIKNDSIYNEEYFFGGHNLLDDIKGAQLKSCLQEKSRIERFIPSGRILDVGCGNGKFLRVLGDAWKKYGCDVAPAAVQFVRQNRLFNVRLGLLEELDYPKQFFDVVYFRASLHHTENPRKTLEVAHRLVKPSGIVAISMSNNAAGPCGRVFKGKTRSFDYGHTHFFTPATLRKLLRLCGLQEIYTYYPYFGTGYENFADLGKFVRQTFRLILGRDSDLVSPPFYGNYVSMFATPIHQ